MPLPYNHIWPLILTNPCLPRYLLEHGLGPDGLPDPNTQVVGDTGSFDTFFSETRTGKWVPRSIFVDLDPSVRIPKTAGEWLELIK